MPAPTLSPRTRFQPAPLHSSRWTRWVLGTLGAVGVAGFAWFNFCGERDPLSEMAVVDSHLVRVADGEAIEHVNPVGRPGLLFRTTLDHAPVGRRLWLACDWFDPDGKIVHQNHYQTLRIDSEVCSTQSAFTLPSDARHGTWSVQLKHDGRLLARQSFLVNDKPPPVAPRTTPIAASPTVKHPAPAAVTKSDPPAPTATPQPSMTQPPVAATSSNIPAANAPSTDQDEETGESVKPGAAKKSTKWYRRKRAK